jgi:hypothetical protein
LSISQQLDAIPSPLDQTGGHECSFIDNSVFFKPCQVVKIHNGVPPGKNVGEPALGQPPLQWHLTTFVTRTDIAAGS